MEEPISAIGTPLSSLSIVAGRSRYPEEGSGSSDSKMRSGPLLSIRPEEITFEVELKKPAYCNLKVINNSDYYVAFKVKTTAPKKYFVRPTISTIQPWDMDIIMITLEAQKELPPDLECKDKFLVQSIKLPPHLIFEDIPPDLFNKDDNKVIEECKLRVLYIPPRFGSVKIKEESEDNEVSDPDLLKRQRSVEEAQSSQRLREEIVSTLQQNKLLQQQVEMLTRIRDSRSYASVSLTSAIIVGLIGLLIGMMLNLGLSRRSAA